MIGRRQFLALGGATLLGSILGTKSNGAQVWPSPLVVVLTDIDLKKNEGLANRVVDVFKAHRIPIVIALALEAGVNDKMSSEGIKLLKRIAANDAKLCEVGLHVAELRDASSYRMLRAVSDAQTEYQLCIESLGHRENWLPPRTLITEGHSFPNGISSPVRAAGISSIIGIGNGTISTSQIESRAGGKYAMAPNGVAYFIGSINADSAFAEEEKNSFQSVKVDLLRQAELRYPIAMRLSINALSDREQLAAIAYVEQLAELIDDTVRAGQTRYLTASTLFEQSYDGPSNYRVQFPRNNENDINELATSYLCAKGLGIEDVVMTPARAGKFENGQSLDSIASATMLPQIVETPSAVGLDKFGRLHIPSHSDSQVRLTDSVVQYPDPAYRSSLVNQLELTTVAKIVPTNFSPVLNAGEYYRTVLGSIPVLEYIQHARATAAAHAGKSVLSPIMIASYRADAQTAWRYFERFSKRFHNLAPATIWIDSDGSDYYPILTMWDVGSLVLAAVSAFRIGIIDEDKLTAIGGSVAKFLTKAKFFIGRSRLPPLNWSATQMPGDRSGFDSADVGRLLIALKILDRQTNGTLKIGKLVASWDLVAALEGGHLHDHNGRNWVSTQRQLYSIYAQRGYSLWGFETTKIFDDEQPASTMDRAVAFIEDAAARGPFATEPFVTDAVELGASEHSRLIADVMFGAQIKRFATSGNLTAASEGPIDVQPWFTYQGLNLQNDDEQWTVHVPAGHRDKQTAKFEKENRLQNSKASYLWAAARPHDYHDKLVQNIRAKAATLVGFSSGVRELTGKRTNVADINTNALVLESIAYLIGGQVPLFEV